MRKYRQCGECGRIRVRRGRWRFPLEAIAQKKIKPNRVVKIPECPKCKDTVTFNIITSAVPFISKP